MEGYEPIRDSYILQVANNIVGKEDPNSVDTADVGGSDQDLATLLTPFIEKINDFIFYNGITNPSDVDGEEGDYYIQTNGGTSLKFYRKNGTTWVLQSDIPLGISYQDGILIGLRTQINTTDRSVYVTNGSWVISNSIYSKATPTFITYNAPASGANRIDLIYATTLGTILYLAGAPSATPVKPSLPANTIEVDSIYVPAEGTGDAYLFSSGGTSDLSHFVTLDTVQTIIAQKRFLAKTLFGNGGTTGETWIGKHEPGDGTIPSYPPEGDCSAITVRNPETGNYISMSEYEYGMTINFRSIQPHGTRGLEFHSDYGDGITPNYHAIATLIGQGDQNSFQVRDVGDANGIVLRARSEYADLFEILTEQYADILIHMPEDGDSGVFGKLRIQADVIPEQGNTWDMGKEMQKWKNIYGNNISAEVLQAVSTTTGELLIGFLDSDPQNGRIIGSTAEAASNLTFTDGLGTGQGHQLEFIYNPKTYGQPDRLKTPIGFLAVIDDFASGQSIGARALGTTLDDVLEANNVSDKGAEFGDDVKVKSASNAVLSLTSRTVNEPQISFEDSTGAEQTGSLLAYNFNFMTNGTTRVGIGHLGEVEVPNNAGTPTSVVRNSDILISVKSIRAITSPTTILATDYTVYATSGTFTQPLPATTLANGQIINISNTGIGTLTITATSINGQTSVVLASGGNLQVQFTGTSGTYIIL